MKDAPSRMRQNLRPFALLVLGASAIIACTGGPSGTTRDDGEDGNSGERDDGSGAGGEGSSQSSPGATSEGSSPGQESSEPSQDGVPSGSSSGSSASSSSSGGSSGSSSSGGSTAPRAECVAWANRHCSCLEAVNAATADCRTKAAKGCEDGVSLCPAHLSWYTCSQVTCGNTCPRPDC